MGKMPNQVEMGMLYSDDFLAGFTLADSPAFDDWQAYTTNQLRATLATTLEHLVDAHVDQRQHAQAIDYACRWVALDPLHEQAHRQLMELYARSDQQSAALRQFLCRGFFIRKVDSFIQ